MWKPHPKCTRCLQQDLTYIRDVRQIAIDCQKKFSWTYLDPQIFSESWAWPSPKDVGMVLLIILVQVFVRLVIAFQLYDELVEEDESGIAGSLCPHRSNEFAGAEKFFACVLNTLFGVVSVANILGKIRGMFFATHQHEALCNRFGSGVSTCRTYCCQPGGISSLCPPRVR